MSVGLILAAVALMGTIAAFTPLEMWNQKLLKFTLYSGLVLGCGFAYSSGLVGGFASLAMAAGNSIIGMAPVAAATIYSASTYMLPLGILFGVAYVADKGISYVPHIVDKALEFVAKSSNYVIGGIVTKGVEYLADRMFSKPETSKAVAKNVEYLADKIFSKPVIGTATGLGVIGCLSGPAPALALGASMAGLYGTYKLCSYAGHKASELITKYWPQRANVGEVEKKKEQPNLTPPHRHAETKEEKSWQERAERGKNSSAIQRF